VYRGGWGLGVQTTPSPKFRSFDKFEPNSQFRGKYTRNNLIRIWGSLICKLSGNLDWGATAPNTRSLGPRSKKEFVDPPPPPPRKNSVYSTESRTVVVSCRRFETAYGVPNSGFKNQDTWIQEVWDLTSIWRLLSSLVCRRVIWYKYL
jgi:hypothetical protein